MDYFAIQQYHIYSLKNALSLEKVSRFETVIKTNFLQPNMLVIVIARVSFINWLVSYLQQGDNSVISTIFFVAFLEASYKSATFVAGPDH